ncbi:phage tail tape measure protein [Bradyrhizobium barranii]|uniref:phage tail tape measure protein n=1 Tax=Bradyrhizobium barranii TaxID=2992140 RepID=UPI001AA0F0BC|nr:phage tail tape measure protein [Bradyrhizobium barranii]
MSDNLDIRARLTAEDNASPTIKRLLDQIKRLEAKLKTGLGKSQIGASIMDEKSMKLLTKGGKEIDGLTQKYMRWARAQRDAGQMSASSWQKLTSEINDHVRAFEKAGGKISRQRRAQFVEAVKREQAFRAVWNQSHRDRIRMEERMHDNLSRIESSAMNRRLREERRMHAERSRMRRDALVGLRQAGQGRGMGLIYAGAAAYGGARAAQSSMSTRMRVDTAEAQLQMFGEMSRDQIKAMRKDWGNKQSIRMGIAPDQMLNAFTETLKAGIPANKAREVTETILKSAGGLGLDIANTTKFAARVATLTQDMKNLDPAALKSVMNAVAIAARDSGADANEIVAANRRGSGVLATSKMTMEQLSAFTAAGISADMPSGKTGTFLGFMVNEMVGAKNARGQRAKDLGSAANVLGFGGRAGLSQQMSQNPADTLVKIFDKMGNMPEQQRAKIANQLGMREWRDELSVFVQVRDDVARLLGAVADPKNKNMLDETSAIRLQSLAGRWNQISSAFKLVWEAVGSGLEKVFGAVGDFVTDYVGRMDLDKLSKQVEAFTDGIVSGLGYNSWSEAFKAAFGNPEDIKDYSRTIFLFVKGFVAELKSAFTAVKDMFTGIAKAMGYDTNNPEQMGKFAARLLEIAVALKAVGAVADALASIVTFVKGLAAAATFFTTTAGAAVLAAIGAALGTSNVGIPDANIRRKGESVKEWRERQSTTKRLRNYKTPSEADPLFQPSSYTGSTDFSGRRRGPMDDLVSNVNKLGGNVERAAFIGGFGSFSGSSGGLQTAALGGGRLGGGLGGGGGSSAANPMNLLKSVPGAALPNFGVGSGGIIRRGGIPSFGGGGGGIVSPNNVPSFSGGGGSAADNVGAGLSGNAFLAARRAKFAEEIKNDPNLALHLAAMQQTEGASKGGTIESLMNRADMQGKSLRQMLGFSADGVRSTDARGRQNSFYGPIRRGEIYGAIRRMQNNPAEFAKYDAFTKRALAGGHVIGGYTDQGLSTDPNGSARTGIAGFKISPKDGNEFTDWVGPGSAYGRGRAGAMNYRKFIEQGIAGSGPPPGVTSAVPSPAEVVKNVPAIRPNGDAGMGGRGSSGNVAIHINGSNHDPEALATLVQRRVDESMNWRMNDTESEYT